MPAGIEETDNVVLANRPAWHGLGTVIDTEGERGISIDVALKEAKLDWEVEKVPAFGLVPKLKIKDLKTFQQRAKAGDSIKLKDLVPVQDRWAVQRKSDGRMLGVVGNTWQPVQNSEGFQIIQDVIEQAGGSTVWIESAGSLENGRRVWVLAHIDSGLQIAGESYKSYLLFTNGHNGRMSVTAAAVDMRVVCANTLDYAIMGEAKESGRIVRVRHTVKASERIQEAHAILGMRNKRAEDLAKQGEWLVSQPADEGAFETFLETLMAIPEDQEDKPAGTMIRKRRDQVRTIYHGAENLKPIRDTWWGVLQSVLDYSDHGREFKDPETQLKAAWGITAQPLKQQAYELATTFALSS